MKSLKFNLKDFISTSTAIIIVIILLFIFPGTKPTYSPISEAEFLEENTAKYTYDANNEQYTILFKLEYTDYIGSKEIDSYMARYSDSELEQYVNNFNSPLISYQYKYGIWDKSPNPTIQYDEYTGWKSTYYIRQLLTVDKDYFENSDYDINSFVKDINESYYTYSDYLAKYESSYKADIHTYYYGLIMKGVGFFLCVICITHAIVSLLYNKFLYKYF